MKKRVLLSIHPEYAEAILAGQKQFEFRRVLFKQDVDQVFIYATCPVARVVGSFQVENIYSEKPPILWKMTKDRGGVTKEKFDSYFGSRPKGFAIKITNPVRFATPRPLSDYVISNIPPQSFRYI
jgi:predicted transcriptional regulator